MMARRKTGKSKKTLKQEERELAFLRARAVAEKPAEMFKVEAQDIRSAVSPFAKLSAAEYAKRRNAVASLMSYAHTQADIAAAMKEEFSLEYNATVNLIKRITKQWNESQDVPMHIRKAQARTRTLQHISRASDKGQMSAAIAGEVALMKLDGLEAPKQINVTIDIGERTQQALARAFQMMTPQRMHQMAMKGATLRRLLQDVQDDEAIEAEYEVTPAAE